MPVKVNNFCSLKLRRWKLTQNRSLCGDQVPINHCSWASNANYYFIDNGVWTWWFDGKLYLLSTGFLLTQKEKMNKSEIQALIKHTMFSTGLGQMSDLVSFPCSGWTSANDETLDLYFNMFDISIFCVLFF